MGKDDDPFRLNTCRRVDKSKGKKRATKTQPPSKKTKTTPAKKTNTQKPITAFLSPSPTAKASQSQVPTHCSHCSLPVELLPATESLARHKALCSEMSHKRKEPCPSHEKCDSRQPSHYKRFRHGTGQSADLSMSTVVGSSRRDLTQDLELTAENENVLPDQNEETVLVEVPKAAAVEESRTPVAGPSKPVIQPLSPPPEPNDVQQDCLSDSDLFTTPPEQSQSSQETPPSTPTKPRKRKRPSDTDSNRGEEDLVKVSANYDSERLDVRLEVTGPDVKLTGLKLTMDCKSPSKAPITVTSECERTTVNTESKAQWAALLSKRKKEETKERLERAQRNGFVTPATDSSYNQRRGPPRQCPFYKKIPGTAFTVDAFNYGSVPGITKYFLSHFHYDHYQGLTKYWKHPIYCSEITARLVNLKLRPNSELLKPLPMDTPVEIEGAEVTLLEANHCPGAVMFLFKLKSGQCLLHVGDFRAVPLMESYPALWSNKVNKLFLDTTYCKEEHDFPAQSDVIDATVRLVSKHLERHERTLVAVGSYTIGKERVFLALAEKFDFKIWAAPEKVRVLRALRWPALDARLVATPHLAQLHVLDMRKVKNKVELESHLDESTHGKYSHVLGVTPTGWTHSGATVDAAAALRALRIRGSKGSGRAFFLEVPYSEHSSFSELKRFVQFLNLDNDKCIVPTVNVGNGNARAEMSRYFKEWLSASPKAKRKKITNYFEKKD